MSPVLETEPKVLGARTQPQDSCMMIARMKRGSTSVRAEMARIAVLVSAFSASELSAAVEPLPVYSLYAIPEDVAAAEVATDVVEANIEDRELVTLLLVSEVRKDVDEVNVLLIEVLVVEVLNDEILLVKVLLLRMLKVDEPFVGVEVLLGVIVLKLSLVLKIDELLADDFRVLLTNPVIENE
ncbi:hypothetical protein Tdes44962_MAKER03187 [Teratosphaeria destructans]|uniref:Uncharacterized protein n=1 Tax=Teratosphaeria destructans TaxID=418781 RepID=A0A9W7W1T7_9PEZI|nr:hypothetical protein Tdes44962_MAKER03187 [Teratosphaeria destructans]